MIWLDGLDIPTVRHFDAGFAEGYPEKAHPETAPPGDTLARYGRNLRPVRGSTGDRRARPPAVVPLSVRRLAPALAALAASADIDPHLGHALEFVNPADGGPVMPTIAAHVRLLPTGFETRARRSTDGAVFVVVEGSGWALVEGPRDRAEAARHPRRPVLARAAPRGDRRSGAVRLFRQGRTGRSSICTRSNARDPGVRTPSAHDRRDQQGRRLPGPPGLLHRPQLRRPRSRDGPRSRS
ncbi:hypothetical protein ACRAWD_23120 [Caulobacter segnis]